MEKIDIIDGKFTIPEKHILSKDKKRMTSSNGLKSAVSEKRLQAIAQPLTVSTRKPSIKKVSLLRGRLLAKPFLNGSLNVQPTEEATTFQSGGGRYDYKRISALQSNKIQSGCEDSNSEDRFSLQVQHKLPHYMDSEVSEEVACGEGV